MAQIARLVLFLNRLLLEGVNLDDQIFLQVALVTLLRPLGDPLDCFLGVQDRKKVVLDSRVAYFRAQLPVYTQQEQ